MIITIAMKTAWKCRTYVGSGVCNLCERTDYRWKTVSMKCCQPHWKSQGICFGMQSGHPANLAIRIRIPGNFWLKFWRWRRFALSKHGLVDYVLHWTIFVICAWRQVSVIFRRQVLKSSIYWQSSMVDVGLMVNTICESIYLLDNSTLGYFTYPFQLSCLGNFRTLKVMNLPSNCWFFFLE